MKKIPLGFSLGLLMVSLVIITGCGKTIVRTSADTQVDLSGYWNDTDSQLTAEAMIDDCLARPWLDDFMALSGKKPDLLVGLIMNKSHEHINTDTFIKELERTLINSGKVHFVAGDTFRKLLRRERKDQDTYASDSSRKKMGEEAGADFMLFGSINTIIDKADGTEVRYYQIDLELVNMTTNRKVWIGDKKIKKIVDRSSIGW